MMFLKKLPSVDSAFFCMTLKTGSITIALGQGLLALVSIIVNILEIAQIIDPLQHSFNLNTWNQTKRDFGQNELITDDIFMILLEMFFTFTCVLLFVGALKEIRKFMFIWMIALCLKLLLDILITITMFMFAILQRIPYLAFALFILLLLPNASFLVYGLIIVKSLYEKIDVDDYDKDF